MNLIRRAGSWLGNAKKHWSILRHLRVRTPFIISMKDLVRTSYKTNLPSKFIGMLIGHSGQFFAVTVRLGGRLTSTHHIEKVGKQNLSETKNRLKAAAAVSISGPAFAMSAKGSYEHQGEENNGGSTVSNADSLAWQATGGDTTLASKWGFLNSS